MSEEKEVWFSQAEAKAAGRAVREGDLTGKCKKDFEEWLNHKSGMKFSERELFYNNRLTSSMQWGILQDFFDSVGIVIELYTNHSGYGFLFTKPNGTMVYEIDNDIFFKTRQDVRKAAIEKANEIYNS